MAGGHTEIKWIKIATNLFADEKILLIEQMPDADTIIVIWFKLLCMAGRENNCGVFVMGNKIPYTDEMLAAIFRRPLTTIRLALKTFVDFGMIEIIELPTGDGVVTIPNWEKHQNIDGMEKIREQNRLRKQKQREKQKMLECHGTVTQCHATEEEKEEEKEEEREKKNKKESAPYVADAGLNDAIISFIEYRKKIKKPMTERAITLLISELQKLSPDILTQIEIINQSILNGWQGVFPLKNNRNQSGRRQEAVPDWMKKNPKVHFENERQYDFDAIERDLLANADFEEQKQAAEERIKEICSQ